MKSLISILIIGSMLLGCAPVMVNAPPYETKLLSESDSAPGKTTLRCWYLLWGLVPISNNATDEIIAQKGYKGVRAKVYHNIIDIVIDVIFGGIIYSQTVEIEGTTTK
ncbi:MAG: hypothetical protein ACUVTF_06575 [bacterium]